MGPDNVKLLLQSFIECKQNQDECDSPRKTAEYDNPIRPHPFACQSSFPQVGGSLNSVELPAPIEPVYPFSFDPAPNLPDNVIQVGRNLLRLASQFSDAQPDKSIIKFKEICMVKEPVEQTISIPVMRDEKFSHKIMRVSWKTCDKTALSGTHYLESAGEIVFNQGDTSKDIEVQILNSDDEADDLRFLVELSYDGLYNPNPMTVSLKKIKNLEQNERTVLHNLPHSLPFSVSDVKCALDCCLNSRTFHMALTHLCSTSTVLDVQIALALELSSLCIQKSSGSALRQDSILRILSDFFRRDEYKI